MGKIEYQEHEPMINSHVSWKYVSLALYDEDTKKIFINDHKILEFNKTDGWNLIVIPEKEDETLYDHDYFCIHDDICDRICSTHQDRNVL